MSYCLGMRLAAGLVFVSDSRSNAGIDNIATFRKTFVFDDAEDRVIVVLVAGNLAVTQSVVSLLEERLPSKDPARSLYAAPTLYDAASVVGETLREVYERDGSHLKTHGADFVASMIVGGQIRGKRARLFNIYSAGNFIEATEDTPYFQIGETKYGKPIIERVLTADTPLIEATKCALVSFDSTIKANLSVAPPLDITICPADALQAAVRYRLREDDPYFQAVRRCWGEGLRSLFTQLPDPDWPGLRE